MARSGKGVGTTKYTYDGMDVVLDDGSDGVMKYQNAPGIDNKLKLTSGGISKYFLQDHLGSTVGLTDANGAITSSASYDSFGNSTNNLMTRYQFTGREYDSFTGLTYYRARWYDSNLGRFISQDPIGFAGKDINWFSYVHNNPLMYFDPEGTQVRSDSRWEPYSREDNQKMIQAIQSMPNPPDTGKFERIMRCHQNYKFSALFGGIPYGEGTVEFLEVGSLLSLGADGVATGAKSLGPKMADNPYGSGINMLSRRISRNVPNIGGKSFYAYARPIGDKATPALAVFGAFTFSYNTTVDIQCICGVLE